MWQYTLLQFLIALIPIGALQAWLAYTGKVRHANLLIGSACGVSMLLAIVDSSLSSPFLLPGLDLSCVPYLIGSLYGGIPAASVLTALFMAAKWIKADAGFPLLLLGLFLVLFVPYLFLRVSSFRRAGRKGKLRIAVRLALFNLLFIAAQAIYQLIHERLPAWEYKGTGLLFAGMCFLLIAALVYMIEDTMGKLRLQTEYRQMTANYHNEASRLQRFIDCSPLIVVFVDREGNVSHLNEPALKLLAPLRREEVLGRPYRASLRQWQCEALLEAVSKAMEGADRTTDLCVIRNRIYYTTVCSWGRGAAPRTEGVALIAHDVTELERLKDEINKMERLSLVGQMAASITHEIRNPMAVIRGFVQLLNERSPKEQHSYYQIILQELDRANSIINDFLSLAQNRIVEKDIGDLHAILEELLPLLQADANMRGQIIEMRLSPRIEPLELNVKEIKQLVLNLARNGMEAMDDKGVLRIETENLADAILLRVVDNGTGIPPEKLEKLFEPFYTTKANGTGLGLPLCHSIVERHNGQIRVESAIGKGTSFIVSFGRPAGSSEELHKNGRLRPF